MNREKLAIVFSFIFIFAFNSIDNAIAPLVKPISETFLVPAGKALWLISICTGGTVLALLLGPAILSFFRARRLLLCALATMTAAQGLFALTGSFGAALFFRAVSGFAAGIVATIMWRLTFHGVSKENFPHMIAVLMSARPLATAIGVPLAGLMAWKMSWQTPVWAIAALTTLSGFALYLFFPENADGVSEQKTGIIAPYAKALSVPHAAFYYCGVTINRMAYFGFYAFCGIWFDRHYGLNIKSISVALLIIGLAEALINFSTAKIIKRFGHKPTFLASLGVSTVLLPLFIFGKLPLPAAVALITVFMLLDRIYSMALVISIPQMFPSTGDKTAFGSLNTLTAWGAMMLISGFQGKFLGPLGMPGIEAFIVLCFLAGSAMLYAVQQRTVFAAPPQT
ncbi:MAG TPA: MFS transporter [Elusimicrobiales bacterium]|nr:MFS transporter [Elusimicrobiales bacterium]